MSYLLTILFLFIVGSLIGYVIELFYRRYVSMKRWINPGFLKGPYLPIYGFGISFFYVFSNINYLSLDNSLAPFFNPIISILILGILMTLLELIGGLVFIKGLNIKLWDYSNIKGNYKGIICPLFSLIWTTCAALYYFLVNPLVLKATSFFNENIIYFLFFMGLFYGFMIFDFAIQMNLAAKIKQIAKESKVVVNFELIKVRINDKKAEYSKKYLRSAAFLNESKNYINEIKNKISNKINETIFIDPNKHTTKK